MKITYLLLSALLSTSAHAGASPAFTCVRENGYRYSFFLEPGEIHVANHRGQPVERISPLSVEHFILESQPPQDQFRFFRDEDEMVAVLTFTVGERMGSGEMMDSDEAMECGRE